MSKEKLKAKIFVISGPSGSGKTTLLGKLLEDKKLKKVLARSVSLTTRPKRSGERQGRHYFFVSEEDFKKKLRAKKILEWTKYLGYYYATPKDFLEAELKKGKNIALCIDLKGVYQIRKLYPQNAVTIFIAPPSIDVLHDRIRGRCHRTKKEEIRQRLKLAAKEMRAAKKFTYSLLNDNLEQAANSLKEVILRETANK